MTNVTEQDIFLFDTVFKEVLKAKERFISDETMSNISEHIDKIKNIYNVSLNISMLDTVMDFGHCIHSNDFRDFIVDLTAFRNDVETDKLIQIVLDYDPEFFHALERRFHSYNIKNKEDRDKYIELLKKIIKVGTEQNENIWQYQSRLNGCERPAKDKKHAASIAYFENIRELEQRYPDAFFDCGNINDDDDYIIQIAFESGSLPPNEIINIDGFEVPVIFCIGKRTWL